ncbi:hypothetical protein FWD20_02505 [Candidatus Saccharibacteria bacterium]|nr:hypothetical protein [Candidatus Saccharibacteria bacterium]
MEQIFFSQKLDGLDRLDPGHVWFGYSFNTWQSSDEKLRRELGILSDDGRFCTTFCLAAKLDRSIAIELESAIKANPQFVREVVAGLVMRGFDCSFDDIDLGGVDGKMVRLPPYDKMPDHWPLTMFNMGVDQVSADLPSGGSFLRVTRGGVMESRVDPMTVMTRHKVDKYRPFKYVRELPPRVRANDRI